MNFNQSNSFNTVLPTALLKHTLKTDFHYDWLVGNPLDLKGRLWTARLALDSRDWAKAGHCAIVISAPHRRKYLNYQGPVSDNRGFVKRVDSGQVICQLWEQNDIVLDVTMQHFVGAARIKRVSTENWIATFG